MAKGIVKSTSWTKGQSGNPKGRLSSEGYVKRRREFLSVLMSSGQPKWEELVNKQLQEALSGNQPAMRMIWEYLLPKHGVDYNEDNNDFDTLTESENLKLFDFLSNLMPKNEVSNFIELTKKVTNFVKEIKSQRVDQFD